MRIRNPPIILDNTVVSRFGMTNSFYILKELYSKQLIIPTNVIVESILTTPLEQHVTNALN